ncbi:MAG: P-II family nitrogen regulator [Bacteroidales bacterium]|nr:P-II family nitrogen regulator [Bacteroidales bacterium]
MKKIEAIIRKTKFEEVKETLHNNGIEFFSFWDARGVGMARESRVYRGITYDTSSIERLYLEIVVRDVNLEKTIQALLDSAATGKVGDGKIFVSTLDESIRIRTGEKGDESLYIKD